MKASRPAIALGVLGLLGCAVVGGNAQYFFLSTYRVTNDSGPPVASVHLALESSSVAHDLGVVRVPRGRSRTGWLRFRGEAGLIATLESAATPGHSCVAYVEESQYHVHVEVDAAGGVQCASRLSGLTDVGLLNIIP